MRNPLSQRSSAPAKQVTRREFVWHSSVVTASAVAPIPWSSRWNKGLEPTREGANERAREGADLPASFDEPDLKALAKRALEAATAAGASYADVRFTRTHRQQFAMRYGIRDSDLSIAGVRVLINGAWGFAAHPELTSESMVWMAKTATTLGRANAWPEVPPVVLGTPTPVEGEWAMPVKRDPFEVSFEEKTATLGEFGREFEKEGIAAGSMKVQVNFERQARTFASTEGAYTQQTVYTTFGLYPGVGPFKTYNEFEVGLQKDERNLFSKSVLLSPTGQGYEAFEALAQDIPRMVERGNALLDAAPLASPGRYEVVFDGYAVAGLVNALGNALEIDRILGYEVASGESSYLAPLDHVLGKAIVPTSITITADRTMPGGAATVQWDDEGIAAQAFPLIQSGMLTDCSTGREFLPDLATWYAQQKRTVGSRGCMRAENAKLIPLVQTPNLTLAPSAEDTDFTALLSGITNGFAVIGGDFYPDQQLLTGLGRGTVVYAVKQGKLAGAVSGVGYSVKLPELWKSLVGLGGPRTAVIRGFGTMKGEPRQYLTNSVRAVAARFKDVVIRPVGDEP